MANPEESDGFESADDDWELENIDTGADSTSKPATKSTKEAAQKVSKGSSVAVDAGKSAVLPADDGRDMTESYPVDEEPIASVESTVNQQVDPCCVTNASNEVNLGDKQPSMEPTPGATAPSGWLGGSWTSWGQTIISTARSSATTMVHTLGDGLHTVVETVDSILEIPPPDEMAAKEDAKKKETVEIPVPESEDTHEESSQPAATPTEKKSDETAAASGEAVTPPGAAGAASSWWSGWGGVASKITSTVQNTGKHLVEGGVGVLESIGRRTMDVLEEADPGLARTKALLQGRPSDKPNLSAMLKEARERHEAACQSEAAWEQERRGHFGAQLEDAHGLAHLEALEHLSERSESRLLGRLDALSTEEMNRYKPDLLVIKETFCRSQREEEEEGEWDGENCRGWQEDEMMVAVGGLKLAVGAAGAKLLQVYTDYHGRPGTVPPDASPKSIHETCIQDLAHLTAATVEFLHKLAECLLARPDAGGDFAAFAADLMLVARISNDRCMSICRAYIDRLTQLATSPSAGATIAAKQETIRAINHLIASIYLEMGNGRSYVRDALQRLLPIIQLAKLESIGGGGQEG